MENFFSRLTLDIIGKAVFNYDFDSLTHDDPVIQVGPACSLRLGLPTAIHVAHASLCLGTHAAVCCLIIAGGTMLERRSMHIHAACLEICCFSGNSAPGWLEVDALVMRMCERAEAMQAVYTVLQGGRVSQHVPAALLERAAVPADRAPAAALPGGPGRTINRTLDRPHCQEQARGEHGASTVRRHPEK